MQGLSTSLRSAGGLCLWGGIATLALVLLAGQASPAAALSLELKDAAPDRLERQRAAALGRLPLPGTPDVSRTAERLAEKGLKSGSPIMIRVFKAESELEVWIEKDERFELFATYPICHWSGTLGPKLSEGDKQAPEGFYTITSRQLRHLGRWPRSLNLGFPNAYDRALKRSGSYILVHGGCSSVGCFAMTNPVMSEIHSLATAAVRGGQRHIPTHVFPFRMTDANMAKNAKSEWIGFWSNLKEGYDSFERTRLAPRISVCESRYHIEDSPIVESPLEAGSKSPLAVCGATAAAIQARDKSALLVPLPTLSQSLEGQRLTALPQALRAASQVPVSLTGAASATQSHPPQQMYELLPNPNPQRTIESAPLRATSSSCNTGRASCRKFLALRAIRAGLAGAPRHGRLRTADRQR